MKPPEQPSNIEGTVSAVESIRRHRKRVAVYVDGLFLMELDRDLATEASIVKGAPVTSKIANGLWEEDLHRSAMTRALHFLSYRSRTVQEVRRKLMIVGFNDPVVGRTIDKLERLGYLDDDAFAEQFARSRLVNKAHGPQRIRMDLRRLGVQPRLAEESVSAAADADAVLSAAKRAGAKYWRRAARETDLRKRRWKFVQYLVRRGFSSDVAHGAFEAVRDEAEGQR